jgi:hypothetical protein
MSSNMALLNRGNGITSALGLIELILFIVLLTGRKLPLISDESTIFIALAVIGFMMCTFGGMRSIQPGGWMTWESIVGIMMGILAGMLIITMLFGVKLPYVSGYWDASLILTGLIFIKWVVGLIARFTA